MMTTMTTMDTRSCDYCRSAIPAAARRCPTCHGDFRYCPGSACRQMRGTKGWVFRGWLRGGLRRRCIFCTGPVE